MQPLPSPPPPHPLPGTTVQWPVSRPRGLSHLSPAFLVDRRPVPALPGHRATGSHPESRAAQGVLPHRVLTSAQSAPHGPSARHPLPGLSDFTGAFPQTVLVFHLKVFFNVSMGNARYLSLKISTCVRTERSPSPPLMPLFTTVPTRAVRTCTPARGFAVGAKLPEFRAPTERRGVRGVRPVGRLLSEGSPAHSRALARAVAPGRRVSAVRVPFQTLISGAVVEQLDFLRISDTEE